MTEELMLGIAEVVLLAVMAQWLAWRLRIPSILLLLLTGFAAGPILGRIQPDALLGELLFPAVSLAVAIILFEGGLDLRFSDIRETAHVVRNLVTFGAGITWIGGAIGAYWILDMDVQLAALLGAILVVTGPTVIIPLLRHVQPGPRVGSLLKWEGIVIDPVGAVLAVLAFEAITAAGAGEATSAVALAIARTAAIGMGLGAIGALGTILPIERDWLPDYLHTNHVMMLVIAFFALSNYLQPESGLLTVTVMGVILANQRRVNIRSVVEFNERLQVLFVPLLFILLAARLDPTVLQLIEGPVWFYVAALVLVVRPLAVWVSTLGSPLGWRERAFIAWMAPRGIVAAAVSSIFALELAHAGLAGAEQLVSVTFAVIVGTVALYGLTAMPAAKLLGVREPDPQGFLFLGAHPWAREVARSVHELGFEVLVADLNRSNCLAARGMGLKTYHGDLLSDMAMEEVDFGGLGRFVALTQNDEVNSLAALHMQEVFGSEAVYQLAPTRYARDGDGEMPSRLRGRVLFGPQASFRYLRSRFTAGAQMASVAVEAPFDEEEFVREHGSTTIPMFVVRRGGTIDVVQADAFPKLVKGDHLLCLIDANGSVGEAGR